MSTINSCSSRTGKRGLLGCCLLVSLSACSTAPPQAARDARQTLKTFESRHLDGAPSGLPPAEQGWDRAQWLQLAQAQNPGLAEIRSKLLVAKAGEVTAAQRPNPVLNLSTEYIAAAADMPAWLYGIALDFIVQSSGTRDRAKAAAVLQTQAASTDLVDALWQLRVAVRSAMLDALTADAQLPLASDLVAQRQQLLSAMRLRVQVGDAPATGLLALESDLAAASLRKRQIKALALEARQRLAESVGVPAQALAKARLLWPGWDTPEKLPSVPASERSAALLGRPEVLRALGEYDLAEMTLRGEIAKRWPDTRISPGYTWDHGVRKNQLGVGIPLPLFNRNEGAIGESRAKLIVAEQHMLTVEAGLYSQMQAAEQAWPVALEAWRDAQANEERLQKLLQSATRQRREGLGDRPTEIAAAISYTEGAIASLTAAAEAQRAFGVLENAYHQPLEGPESHSSSTQKQEATP